MATVTAQSFFGGKVPPPPVTTTIHAPETKPGYAQGVGTAAQSGIDKVKAGASQIQTAKNPVDLIEGAAKQGAGAIETATSPLAPVFSPLGKLLGYVSDKLSDHPAVQKFALSNAGEATSRVAGDVANLDEIAGAVAGPKAAGPVAAKAATATVDASRAAASGTGALLKSAGEKSTGIGVNMEVPTRQALQSYQASQPTLFGRVKNLVTGANEPSTATAPTTEANTAVRLLQPGTEWQLGVHAKRVSQELWHGTIAPALRATKTKVNMPGFIAELKNDIIKGNADLSRRQTLLNALGSFQQDFGKVSNIGFEKLQAYKEGWAKFVPEKAYKGQPIAGALNEVRNMAAQKARALIHKELGGGIKQAYIDYGNLKSIEEAGINSVDPLRSKGLTKQVWEMVMDKAVTPIATTAGKVLYKTGSGLEFLGDKGAKKVRDIVQPR
jgi:hypothetical protein